MGIELTERQQELLVDTLSRFDESNVNYVVLRRHEELPSYIPGTDEKILDIDILVLPPAFDTAYNISQSAGFVKNLQQETDYDSEYVRLVNRAIRNPVYAIKFALNSPSALLQEIYAASQSDESTSRSPYEKLRDKGRISRQLTHKDQQNMKFDLKAHLAYRSPDNNRMYRIDPAVEEAMINRRDEQNGIYKPSPPDELAHLICHRLYDKEGNFTEYYIERCNQLKREVYQSEQMNNQFQELLEKIFFGASEFVSEEIEAENYNNLRDRLKAYSAY